MCCHYIPGSNVLHFDFTFLFLSEKSVFRSSRTHNLDILLKCLVVYSSYLTAIKSSNKSVRYVLHIQKSPFVLNI